MLNKIDISRKGLLELVKQLDEPGKVTIPQYVVDWIKYCKLTGVNLYHALEMGDLYFFNYANQKDYSKLKEFFEVKGNQELFARAWLDGYEVEKENEKEKRYCIVVKHTNRNCLKYDKYERKWYFGIEEISSIVRKDHTRKELEDAGFGWVFDCQGIEIEEVK